MEAFTSPTTVHSKLAMFAFNFNAFSIEVLGGKRLVAEKNAYFVSHILTFEVCKVVRI